MRDEPLTTCKRKKRKLRSKEAIRAAAHAKRGNESSDDEFYQEEVADAASQWLKRKHQKVDPHLTRIALRLSLETEGSFQMTNAEYEDRIAFCCKVCHCPESIKVQYKDQEYVQASGELTQWHRRCCHSDEIHDETWASPFLSCLQEVNQLLYSDPCPKCNKPDNLCVVCQAEILQKKGVERVDPKVTLQKYWQNIKEGNEIIGEDFHEVINDRLRTNRAYSAHEKWFRQMQTKAIAKSQSKAAVVVDLFGGIGSAVVVLKRLNIAISKVIHVEHDKVANYVYKYWNCLEGKQEDDGIKHIFVPYFETFQEKLHQLMDEHGPFDIVIGGPPCVDYTEINSRRMGVDGKQGSYLTSMGVVIQEIQHYNKARNCNFFYLAENAALSNGKEKELQAGDLQRVLRSFGIEWHMTIDSRDHTPLRRKRTYITNIPILEDLKMFDPPPRLCFDDGYDVAGMIFDPESGLSKAAGLMANKLRLDDHPRMSIYKEYGTRYLKFLRRSPTVEERERLMGFPPNYVSRPLKKLFSSLISGGFASEALEFNKRWQISLPKEFHAFAGDYHRFRGRWAPFKFYAGETSDLIPVPAVKLKLAPPLATKKPQYYTEEQYAKRLIGNAFSIPTVEYLLSPIKPFFGKRDYPNCNYVFSWEGWDPKIDKPPERSERVKALMHEHADNDKGKASLPRVPSKKGKKIKPPNVVAAARARQSAGKLSFPAARAMEKMDQQLLIAARCPDKEGEVEEIDV